MIQTVSILLYCFASIVGSVSFDKSVHDFGRVEASSEPLICIYTFKNDSDADVRIRYAHASCSCLNLTWTTDVVHPGESGNVIARYTRLYDEYYFDKDFIVEFEEGAGSFSLSVKGCYYETPASLKARFPYSSGPFLFRRSSIDVGGVPIGKKTQVSLQIANPGESPVTLSFDSLPPFVSLVRDSVSIAPFGIANAALVISPNSQEWGYRSFKIVPTQGGQRFEPVELRFVLIDDFSSLPNEERYAGSYSYFPIQSYSVPRNCIGIEVPVQNLGKQPLHIRAVDCDSDGVLCGFPDVVAVGDESVIHCTFSPSFFDSSQNICTLYAITDSPVNPLVRITINKE